MARIARPDTAFSAPRFQRREQVEGQRAPRVKSEKHLAFIRSLPCLICGCPSEAAHIRMGDPMRCKRETGMQEKPDDRWTVPLCRDHHAEQHSMSEREWWLSHGLDPIGIATALWIFSGDDQTGRQIVAMAHAYGWREE